MSGYMASRDSGVVTASETSLRWQPKVKPASAKCGIVLLHGATTDDASNFWNPSSYPNVQALIAALADAGYPLLAIKAGGDLWGNSTARSRVDDAKTYLQSTMGAKAGPVALLGMSMGAALAYNWTLAHPASVACLVQILPVSDLNDMVTNNRGGLAASINTAYSTYSEATHGPANNPTNYKASLAGTKCQVWYSTTDAVVIPATVTGVTTAIGGVDLHTLTGAHGDSPISGVTPATVLSFLAANT